MNTLQAPLLQARRWLVSWGCLGVLALSSGLCTAEPAAREPVERPEPAVGLIIKLRQAPAHANARPHAAGATVSAESQAQSHRMQRLLSSEGVPGAHLRAHGRAAHVLDFGRRLSSTDAQAMADRLRQRPEVEWVVLNERERRLQVPADPYFAASASSSGQWWLRAAGGSSANALQDRLRGVPGLQSAWPITTGDAAAVVAVLDTGITAHPDLDNQVLAGHDFVSDVSVANDGDGRDADPHDPGDAVTEADVANNPAVFSDCDVVSSSWHGTLVAGIVAATTNNGIGVAGTHWNGRVLPVRVAGRCGADVADIVDGMRWAAGLPVAGAPTNANPARIINISFGGSAACNAAYQEAIDELRAVGAVVVAAAGNGRGAVKRPASCNGVIGVAALNRDGFKAVYSNFGSAVKVSTVGGDPADEGRWGALLGDDGLLTLDNLGLQGPEAPSYGHQSGTSFATPIVAGVLSLMLSVNPALTAEQMIDGIVRTVRPHVTSVQMDECSVLNPGRCECTTATCGAGILDAREALLYASFPAGYVVPAREAASVDSAELSAAVGLGADVSPDDAAVLAAGSAGGGGAVEGHWLAGLALALLLLARQRGRSARPVRLHAITPSRPRGSVGRLGARHESLSERR